MECERCGSCDFTEEDGFYFCNICQTQSQGFAKEVRADDDEFVVASREVHIKSENHNTRGKPGRKKRKRDRFSRWTTIEGFNHIYLGLIEDFFTIVRKSNPTFVKNENQFLHVTMQIWFKYLRENEIAFLHEEHIKPDIKLHPASRSRDTFLLASSSSTSNDPVPLYCHSFSVKHNKPKQSSKVNRGKNYQLRDKGIQENISYYDDNGQPDKYQNPHKYHNVTRPENTKNLFKTRKAQQCFKMRKLYHDKDIFLKYAENVVEKKQMADPIVTTTKEEYNSDEDDKLMDDNYFDDLIRERMPIKLKRMLEFIPMERMKNCQESSALLNEHITKPKLLAFLYISIRLFNMNIYLSDLIRWCIQNNIRYIKSISFLPQSWEIMFIDQKSFNDNRYPRYQTLSKVVTLMIEHCSIPRKLFPKVNIRPLLERYIKDLNLPKGLIIVINQRYGLFLDTYEQFFEVDNWEKFPDFDIAAFSVVLLSLRDLFDLYGSNQNKFIQFENTQLIDDLFDWSRWLNYSMFRLNCIKAFILNLRSKFDNGLMSIDELVATSHSDNMFHRVRKDCPKINWTKYRSVEDRLNLQDMFENLTFNCDDIAWKDKLFKNVEFNVEPSFYPLTTYTKLVQRKINNTSIKNELNLNFHDKLITPYHNSDLHYKCFSPHPLWDKRMTRKTFFEELAGKSLNHLMELGSIITYASSEDIVHVIHKAEKLLTVG